MHPVSFKSISPANYVWNRPTVSVLRSGALDPYPYRCVNIINAFQVKFTTGRLATNQQLLIVASGAGPVNLSLDNGETIDSATNYPLGAGKTIDVIWDGINLVSQD